MGGKPTEAPDISKNPWLVAGVSLGAVALVVGLITLGFCLGRRYCCKAPSVIVQAGNPLPFWHRAWNTMGVYRVCGGHRCATSHQCCTRVHY